MVTATVRFFSTSASGVSPSSLTKGRTSPRDSSVAACATRILEAATIFMALVIFWMFWTERMRCLTVVVVMVVVVFGGREEKEVEEGGRG